MNEKKISDLSKLFESRGYNPVVGTIYRLQQLWLAWYRGEVDGFHNYTKKTMSGVLINKHKPSLQLAKLVAEAWASLLWSEKVELLAGAAQDKVNDVLVANNFNTEMANFMELSGTFGTGVLIEYLAENEVKINFVYGDKILVIDYDNTTIKGIAVIQEFQKDKINYTHVMIHTTKNGKYRIEHEMYAIKTGTGLGKPASLGVLFDDKELKAMRHIEKDAYGENYAVYYFEYDSEPHFQVFKPAITNNWDVKSPMGIAYIANAIAALQGADDINYAMDRDAILSMKKIFIDDMSTKLYKTKNANGDIEYKKYFDESEDVYQVLAGMAKEGSDAMKSFAPGYDSTSHIQAIKFKIDLVSFLCGLGTDYFSFENGSVYVNELNIMSSNSDTWRNRQKHLNNLYPVLIGMMKSIVFLLREVGGYSGEDPEYDVKFDDSIIEDNTSNLTALKQDAMDGIIPSYMYIMAKYKVDKETALGLIAESKEENKIDYNDVIPDDEE